MVFTSLGHLINKEMLENCHVQMDGTKAVGIDGVTKEEYGRNLEENLEALIESLKKKSYKPKPARLEMCIRDSYQPAQAASGKYTGTYTKTWSVSSNMTVTIKPSYSVIVNKVTSTKVRLQLEKLGVNGSPIYATAPITAKRKGNTVSFKWKDTWGNSGTGTLKLYKGYVKLKVKQTYTARWNRSTLDTSGKYMKIYRQSGNTKMDNIDL